MGFFGGGINWTSGASLAFQGLEVVTKVLTQPLSSILPGDPFGPYADPNQSLEPTYSVVVPPTTTDVNDPASASQMYVFDAVLVANHDLSATPTRKPLQTGQNTTDHIILQPATLIFEIGMSDAMATFSKSVPWSGNDSKSVAAFQQLVAWRDNRTGLTLNTRLNSYDNMYVTNIAAAETYRTFTSLKARVTFSQIFLANVGTEALTDRPNILDTTQIGVTQPVLPDDSTVFNNQVPGTQGNILSGTAFGGTPGPISGGDSSTGDVFNVRTGTIGPPVLTPEQTNYIQQNLNLPGAGTYDSNNVQSLPGVPN